MKFQSLRKQIKTVLKKNEFSVACDVMERTIFAMHSKVFVPLITEIGAIPEDIVHDSSEEKLYAKVADIILARCFQELGLKATVNRGRANCADVTAKSIFHNYTLIGDAKAFRLSRTAKNQKDFKVTSMMSWKGNSEYAVLVCPFFQYPRSNSQIFGQALDNNVLLFSWEHLAFLVSRSVCEDVNVNLSSIWNISHTLAQTTSITHKNKSILANQDKELCSILKIAVPDLDNTFNTFKTIIINRGNNEIAFWENRITEIQGLSKDDAINQLLEALKLNEKIDSIQKFIDFLED